MKTLQLNCSGDRLTGQITPIADESFQSLMVRSLRASGFPYAPHALKHVFDEPRFWYRAASADKFDVEGLGRFLNLPSSEIVSRRPVVQKKLPSKKRQPLLSRPVAWNGTVFDGRLLAHRRRRQPKGWIGGEFRHLQIWAIHPIDFCLQSGFPLIDQCPSCGARLGWEHTDLETCHKCRSALFDDDPSPVSGLSEDSRRKIYSFISPDSSGSAAILDQLGPPFSDLERGEFFVALLEIVLLVRLRGMPPDDQGRARLDTMKQVKPSELQAAWDILNSFDAYLYKFLSDFEEPSRLVSMKQHFRPMNKFFGYGVKSPLSHILTESLPRVTAKKWPGCVVSSTGLVSPDGARATSAVLTESGVSKKRLSELNGEPEALIARSSGPKGWKVYNECRVKEALREFENCVPMEEVSWRYGFHSHLVEGVLGRLGLSSVEDRLVKKLSRGAQLFNRYELDRWLSEIIRCAEPTPNDALSVQRLMSGLVDPAWWYHLVDTLLDRRLECFAQAEEFKFNDSLLSKREFEDWLDKAKIVASRDLSQISISAEPASRVAGMSQGTIVSAIKNGLLTAEFKERKWATKLIDLKRFLDEFAHLGELSLGVISHRPDIASILETVGLNPKARVTGATLWDRGEVYKKLSEDPGILPGVMVGRLAPDFPR